MLPITGIGIVLRREVIELLFGYGQFDAAAIDLTAATLVRVPVRAGGPRADRRPGPRLLRPAGHADAGRRGILAVVVDTPLRSRWPGRSGCRGSASRSRSAPGSRRRSCSCCSGGGSPELSLGPIFLVGDPVARARRSSPRRVAFALRGGLGLVGADRARHRRAARPRRDRRRGRARRLRRRWRLPCASRSCPLSSGSWPTCSDARAEREPRQPDADVDPTIRRPGTRSSRPPIPARTSSCRRGPQVKAVNGWSAASVAGDGDGSRSVPRSSSGGRARCHGPSPTRRAARSRATGSPDSHRGASPTPLRTTLRERAGRVSHVRIDPEIEHDGPLDPDGALRRALRAADFRPAAPIQPNATRIIDLAADEEALWDDLRKKWRQYVNKARKAGIVVVDAEGDRLPRVLPDLSRDRRSGRVPHPDRAGLSRRLGGLPAARPRPAAVRPDAGRRAARDALPGPQRAAGRRAVRRHDPRRAATPGRTTSSSGRRSGRRASRARRATTCGASRPAGSPTSRPGSAGARSATSGRGTSSSTRSGGRSTRARSGRGSVGAPPPRPGAARADAAAFGGDGGSDAA